MPNKPSVRLPKHIVPLRYQLSFHPNLENFTFDGNEQIQLKFLKAGNTIVLHAIELKITKASWVSKTQSLNALKISYNTKLETVTLVFPKQIKGSGKLNLEFSGIINEDLRGFYKSAYSHNAKQKHLAVTQFAATDARRTFPCFDEPNLKAVFDVAFFVPKHLSVISNTVEKNITHHSTGHKTVKFAATPKMSTYLLAFVIGELKTKQITTKNGVVIRVITTADKINQSQFALRIAKQSLEFLNDYFAIKYPLPTLDLIAVPDFTAGAMENWGAIVFRETALLIDENHSSFSSKQQVAEIVAHELVHQWFGNLVTMDWWTQLWLNESFAHYMSHHTINAIHPEWNVWTKFLLSEQSKGLLMDSLHSTHPVETIVNHSDEINQIFDAISYCKGASILRMLANYLGEEDFRDGLRYYLKKHSYKNTKSIDLWNALEKISGKPVRKLMRAWTEEPGYPFVQAQLSGKSLMLKQNKFNLLPKGPEAKQTLWQIPLQLSSGLTEATLLTKKSELKILKQTPDYIQLNHGQFGFFRVLYDPAMLAKLLRAMKLGKMTSTDQLGLLSDLAQFCKAGHLPTEVYLEAVQYISNKNSYIIWKEVSNTLTEIHNVFPQLKNLDKFSVKLFEPLIKTLGYQRRTKETQSESLLRALVIGSLAKSGHAPTIKFAEQLFNKHLKGIKIHPDYREAIYLIAANKGSDKRYSQLLNLYRQETMQEERRRIARALFLFHKPAQIKTNFQFLLSDEVRSHDVAYLVNTALAEPAVRSLVWPKLAAQWKEVNHKIRSGFQLSSLISSLEHFASAQDYRQIVKFFKDKKISAAKSAYKNSLEKITVNSRWKIRDQKSLQTYLKSWQ